MADKKASETKNSRSLDWLIGGTLTKVGDIFDRLTGRNWKPSSSLATSELILRLKKLLDAEAKDSGGKGKFVPHNIKLKMQWNKFSTDAEDSLKKLEYELLAAAIDYINDNRYHTYKPLSIEIKPDYFTDGVKFLASFGEFDEEEGEISVTLPQTNIAAAPPEIKEDEAAEIYAAEFVINHKPQSASLKFKKGHRISVGRTPENDLSIADQSVSKVHATLMLNDENQILVADTGSTNGTFVGGQRIAYGRALPIGESGELRFGTIAVFLRRVPPPTDFQTTEVYQPNSALPPQNQNADDFVTNAKPDRRFDKTLVINDFKTEIPAGKETANKAPITAKQNFDKE